MSIAVTPTDLRQAAATLGTRAQDVRSMPRGHGLHLRGDLMGSLDDTNRFLANEMAGLGRWIMAVATALTNGAADYEAAEQAITLAIGEPTASSGS